MTIKTTGPIPRAPEQIAARIKDPETIARDIYSAERSRLLEALPLAHALPFLHVGAHTPETWSQIHTGTREQLLDGIRGYLPYTWQKTNAFRVSSIMRSRSHFAGLVWLLGPEADELTERLLDPEPEHGGKHELVDLCELVGMNWRELDDDKWRSAADEPGLPADQVRG